VFSLKGKIPYLCFYKQLARWKINKLLKHYITLAAIQTGVVVDQMGDAAG
jgi:hypothetical protein